MNIAIFGANGRIGQRIVQEALVRSHQVTAIVRNPSHADFADSRITVVAGDARDSASVAATVAGHDSVISAIGPAFQGGDPRILVNAAHALIDGLRQARVKRLVIVGGAGSLEDAPGVQRLDMPDFPAAWKPTAQAHRDALDVYRANTDLDWTYLSPADWIAPGERTGAYRAGGDQMLRDAQGKSFISMEDFAIAILDEVEHPQHVRQRFTVAY